MCHILVKFVTISLRFSLLDQVQPEMSGTHQRILLELTQPIYTEQYLHQHQTLQSTQQQKGTYKHYTYVPHHTRHHCGQYSHYTRERVCHDIESVMSGADLHTDVLICMYQELSMTWSLGEIWRFTWYSNYMCNTMSQSENWRKSSGGRRVDPSIVCSWGEIPLDTDLPACKSTSLDQCNPI